MKKNYVMMAGIMALAAGAVTASAPAEKKVEAQVAAHDETSFATKLSASNQEIFNLMTPELKQAVFSASNGATPDSAVEKVMQENHLALVDGELKAHQN